MSHALRILVLTVALVAAAFGLTACGGDDDTPQELLSQTFGPDKPMKSGKIALKVNLDLKGVEGLSGPVDLVVNGPFQTNGKGNLPSFDLSADLGAGGQRLQLGAVSTGKKGFLKLQGVAFDIGDELYASFKKGYEDAQKQSSKDTKGAPTFDALGIKPLRWLIEPQSKGEDKVGDDDTIRIAAKVDVPKLLADVSKLLDRAEGLELTGAGKVPGGLSAEQRTQVAKAVKSTDVEIWTGKEDKTLRRLRLVVVLDVPADVRKDVRGLESGRIDLSLSLTDLNEGQTIREPANARPLSELTGATGGAQGGGQAQPQPEANPESAPPSANAPRPYLDCLEKAGEDISALQRCADLLQ